MGEAIATVSVKVVPYLIEINKIKWFSEKSNLHDLVGVETGNCQGSSRYLYDTIGI